MEINYTFRNMEPTDALKTRADEKLTKIKKLLVKPGNVHVIFNTDGPKFVVEVTIHSNGIQYVSHDTTSDMYTSLNNALTKLEKQLKRQKELLKNHKSGSK